MRRTSSTNGGAERIWKPTAMLTLPSSRRRNLERAASLRNIDADGLLAVGVLACGGDRVEVLDVEEGRRGDLDGIDVRTGGDRLGGFVAAEGAAGVDGRKIERGIHGIEVLLRRGELVGKDVGEGDDLDAGILCERCCHGGAAPAASKQTPAHAGVCSVAEGGLGLHDHQAVRGGRSLHELASIHLV